VAAAVIIPGDIISGHIRPAAYLLDQYVWSSKVVYAALLLLMLEAANARPRFTISLTAAPKIFSYPQAARRLPHLLDQADKNPVGRAGGIGWE
jgi:hypothetical protein